MGSRAERKRQWLSPLSGAMTKVSWFATVCWFIAPYRNFNQMGINFLCRFVLVKFRFPIRIYPTENGGCFLYESQLQQYANCPALLILSVGTTSTEFCLGSFLLFCFSTSFRCWVCIFGCWAWVLNVHTHAGRFFISASGIDPESTTLRLGKRGKKFPELGFKPSASLY